MFAVTISSALLLKLHNNNNNIYSILFINYQFSYIIQNHYNITKAFIQKYLPNNRITTSNDFVDDLLEDSEIYDYTDTNNESGRPSIHSRSSLNRANNKELTLNEIVKLRFGNSKHKK